MVAMCLAASAAWTMPLQRGLAAQTSALGRYPVISMQEGPPEPTNGIMGVLGGGKTSEEIESNPAAETGSLVATIVVALAFVFATINPDFVEGIAKSQGVCGVLPLPGLPILEISCAIHSPGSSMPARSRG